MRVVPPTHKTGPALLVFLSSVL